MKPFFYSIILAALFTVTACQKELSNPGNQTTPEKPVTPTKPGGFDYSNTKEVSVSIRLLSPDNKALANTPVTFYANVALNDNGNANETTSIQVTRMSDADGYIADNITVPASLDTVLVDAKYSGLIRNVKAYINGNSLNAVIGGTSVISGNIVQNYDHPVNARTAGFAPSASGPKYTFMGASDFNGRPNYLVKPGDVISNKLLTYINTSLPESKNLAETHPTYITDEATGNINVVKQSDVWVTFVSEGASYLNSIGYYTYPTGHEPATAKDISAINIMMPNSSLYGQGGGMYPGDKIKLGNFAAGTSIGFVLLDNAFSFNSGVNTSAVKFYSNSNLNPENDDNIKKHSVVLRDEENKLFLVGFEDILRTRTECDHDFNDVVFYVTASNFNNISGDGVEPMDKPYDADGDGVTDVFDQYPNDPARAYNTYYPSKKTYATLAFEDLWPATGDYDMNDLVVDYRYQFVSNAHNQVVEMFANYAVQGAGASFHNGFGVQFPFSPSIVKQVTGQKLKDNYISLAGNGVEAGQSKAVIIPFDNHEALINNYAGAYFVNTKTSMPKVTGDTAKIYLEFNSPVSFATLGSAPFNPFLISDRRRELEVHLANHATTDKADAKLLGTGDDVSDAATGTYYIGSNTMPWAINIPAGFTYPTESANIKDAYPHYMDWINSKGALYKDWYSNKGSGYRNTNLLYTK